MVLRTDSPLDKIYLLDTWGRSYDAALSLWQGRKKTPFWSAENHDALEACGFLSPAVQVYSYPEGVRRAYHVYPRLYVVPPAAGKTHPDIFLVAPAHYNGTSFIPRDAAPLTPTESALARLILQGQTTRKPETITAQRAGTSMPEPFIAKLHTSINGSSQPMPSVFIAQGRSLDEAQAYTHSLNNWIGACDNVRGWLKEHVGAAYGREAFPILCQAQTPDILCGYAPVAGAPEQTQFTLSASAKMPGGETVTIPLNNNLSFRVIAQDGGYVRIARAEGPASEALAALLAAVPAYRPLSSFAALTDPQQPERQPVIDTLNDATLLIYSAAPTCANAFIPTDAKRMPADLQRWLEEDKNDSMNGIVPPPMPKEIQDSYAAFFGKPHRPQNGPSAPVASVAALA